MPADGIAPKKRLARPARGDIQALASSYKSVELYDPHTVHRIVRLWT
jgi:hypothetical protein